ncbi:hypothetical protein A0H81_14187 [Grifola frondosa]|uniref:Uncharacterized protein n=1 Tax=Grifola frondosa TaxID=5627 RepID=A0A1C7LN02_GRIFR|nr:hypothetical protein A0H81_14187 [Grifola frondosa]
MSRVSTSTTSVPDFAPPTMPTDVAAANEIISTMKGSLKNLSKTLDSLAEQTTTTIQAGGETQTAQHIKSAVEQMKAQEDKQEKQIKEIKALLDEVLQNDVAEHLRKIIEKEISDQIDHLVEEQVNLLLPDYIPQELQDEVAGYRKQLEEVQKALHNSESRQANASLRSSRLDEPIHTIFAPSGKVSALFPKDLNALFSMDADTAKELVTEYELDEVSESRERNVNRFMQFCGVPYQLVRRTRS